MYQDNLILYKKSSNGEGFLQNFGGDISLSEEVKNIQDIKKDETYYIAIQYYIPGQEGNGQKVQYAKECKGSDFYGENEECYLTYYDQTTLYEVSEPNDNTVVATRIGGKRIKNLKELSTPKSENITETASMTSIAEFIEFTNNGKIINHLGNNGKISIAPTQLFVTKIVNSNVDKNLFYELTNENFEFQLDIEGNIETDNIIVCDVYIWNGEIWTPKKDNADTSNTKELIFTEKDENTITTTFTLKDGEGILLPELNPEVKWTVTENLTEDQITRNFSLSDITGRENDEVTINDKTISGVTELGLKDEANYKNNFTFQYSFQTLTIEKVVLGETGDKEKQWEFEVKLKPKDNIAFYDKYEYIGISTIEGVEAPSNGQINLTKNEDGTSSGRIKLKHGQGITIKDLPKGTEYEVKEKEANSNNYVTKSINEKGVLNKDQTVKFENSLKTIEFEFTKVKNENINEVLPGTKFRLYKLICTNEDHTENEHNKIIDEDNLSSCWELYEEVVSDENGKVLFTELQPNEEYRLIEVEAVEGRLKPDGQWKIKYKSYEDKPEITAIIDKTPPPAFIEQDNGNLLLPNMAIYKFPLSGSIGTGIFTYLGLILITVGLGLIYFRISKRLYFVNKNISKRE